MTTLLRFAVLSGWGVLLVVVYVFGHRAIMRRYDHNTQRHGGNDDEHAATGPSCAKAIRRGEGEWIDLNASAAHTATYQYAPECAALATQLFGSTLRLCELEATDLQSRVVTSPERRAAQLARVQRANAFVWQPSPACRAPRVDAARFADGLKGGRRLVIIGDSLSKQHAISLLCLLYPAIDLPATRRLRTGADFAHAFVLEHGGVVQFIFNDRLLEIAASQPGSGGAAGGSRSIAPVATGSHGRNPTLAATSVRYVEQPVSRDGTRNGRRFESWSRRIRFGPSGRADVIVLNTGAHWPLQHEAAYRSMSHSVLAFLLDRDKATERFEGTVLYRTNFLPGCSSARHPTPAAPRAALAQSSYNWAALSRYDHIWAQTIDERAAAGVERDDAATMKAEVGILNVSHLTSLRGDGHCEDCAAPGGAKEGSDCLHYCLPGPVDVWSALLQEIVMP